MEKLTYTKDKPTKPGWYWHKIYKTWPSKVVLIYEYAMPYGVKLMYDNWDVQFSNGLWAGPIEEPEL